MSKESFVVFISIVLILYSSLNYYVYWRTSQVLSGSGWAVALRYLLILLMLAYPVGRLLERSNFFCTHNLLITAGSVWLAALTYLVLTFVLADILFLISRFVPYLNFNAAKFYRWWIFGSYLLTIVTVSGGYYNALHPVTRRLQLTVNSKGGSSGEYRLVFISDIHLGAIIGNGRLSRMVENANAQSPDLILLGGDVFDEDLGPVIKNNMGDLLKELKAKKGVYAVTGNHEYIGGAAAAVLYLENHGIRVLRDSAVVIDSALVLAGRKDYSAARFDDTVRLPLTEILKNSPQNLPVILLDHQPHALREAVGLGVALQLSGHTHHGQLWPFGLLTSSIYEVSRGLKRIGESWIYVSTGYGTWGPPVRTGNRPEMVVVDLKIMRKAH